MSVSVNAVAKATPVITNPVAAQHEAFSKTRETQKLTSEQVAARDAITSPVRRYRALAMHVVPEELPPIDFTFPQLVDYLSKRLTEAGLLQEAPWFIDNTAQYSLNGWEYPTIELGIYTRNSRGVYQYIQEFVNSKLRERNELRARGGLRSIVPDVYLFQEDYSKHGFVNIHFGNFVIKAIADPKAYFAADRVHVSIGKDNICWRSNSNGECDAKVLAEGNYVASVRELHIPEPHNVPDLLWVLVEKFSQGCIVISNHDVVQIALKQFQEEFPLNKPAKLLNKMHWYLSARTTDYGNSRLINLFTCLKSISDTKTRLAYAQMVADMALSLELRYQQRLCRLIQLHPDLFPDFIQVVHGSCFLHWAAGNPRLSAYSFPFSNFQERRFVCFQRTEAECKEHPSDAGRHYILLEDDPVTLATKFINSVDILETSRRILAKKWKFTTFSRQLRLPELHISSDRMIEKLVAAFESPIVKETLRTVYGGNLYPSKIFEGATDLAMIETYVKQVFQRALEEARKLDVKDNVLLLEQMQKAFDLKMPQDIARVTALFEDVVLGWRDQQKLLSKPITAYFTLVINRCLQGLSSKCSAAELIEVKRFIHYILSEWETNDLPYHNALKQLVVQLPPLLLEAAESQLKRLDEQQTEQTAWQCVVSAATLPHFTSHKSRALVVFESLLKHALESKKEPSIHAAALVSHEFLQNGNLTANERRQILPLADALLKLNQSNKPAAKEMRGLAVNLLIHLSLGGVEDGFLQEIETRLFKGMCAAICAKNAAKAAEDFRLFVETLEVCKPQAVSQKVLWGIAQMDFVAKRSEIASSFLLAMLKQNPKLMEPFLTHLESTMTSHNREVVKAEMKRVEILKSTAIRCAAFFDKWQKNPVFSPEQFQVAAAFIERISSTSPEGDMKFLDTLVQYVDKLFQEGSKERKGLSEAHQASFKRAITMLQASKQEQQVEMAHFLWLSALQHRKLSVKQAVEMGVELVKQSLALNVVPNQGQVQQWLDLLIANDADLLETQQEVISFASQIISLFHSKGNVELPIAILLKLQECNIDRRFWDGAFASICMQALQLSLHKYKSDLFSDKGILKCVEALLLRNCIESMSTEHQHTYLHVVLQLKHALFMHACDKLQPAKWLLEADAVELSTALCLTNEPKMAMVIHNLFKSRSAREFAIYKQFLEAITSKPQPQFGPVLESDAKEWVAFPVPQQAQAFQYFFQYFTTLCQHESDEKRRLAYVEKLDTAWEDIDSEFSEEEYPEERLAINSNMVTAWSLARQKDHMYKALTLYNNDRTRKQISIALELVRGCTRLPLEDYDTIIAEAIGLIVYEIFSGDRPLDSKYVLEIIKIMKSFKGHYNPRWGIGIFMFMYFIKSSTRPQIIDAGLQADILQIGMDMLDGCFQMDTYEYLERLDSGVKKLVSDLQWQRYVELKKTLLGRYLLKVDAYGKDKILILPKIIKDTMYLLPELAAFNPEAGRRMVFMLANEVAEQAIEHAMAIIQLISKAEALGIFLKYSSAAEGLKITSDWVTTEMKVLFVLTRFRDPNIVPTAIESLERLTTISHGLLTPQGLEKLRSLGSMVHDRVLALVFEKGLAAYRPFLNYLEKVMREKLVFESYPTHFLNFITALLFRPLLFPGIMRSIWKLATERFKDGNFSSEDILTFIHINYEQMDFWEPLMKENAFEEVPPEIRQLHLSTALRFIKMLDFDQFQKVLDNSIDKIFQECVLNVMRLCKHGNLLRTSDPEVCRQLMYFLKNIMKIGYKSYGQAFLKEYQQVLDGWVLAEVSDEPKAKPP